VLPAFCILRAGSAAVWAAGSSALLALSGVVWGIGAGILYPHLSALSVVGIKTREKGKVLSLFASSVDLGFALGPVAFGWLSQAIGVRQAFLPLALVTFIVSLGLMLWGRLVLEQAAAEKA